MRLFVAIDLDDDARRAIGAEQQRVALALAAGRSLRWVRPDRMHLTLAFLGETVDTTAPGVPGIIIDAISSTIDVRPFTAVFECLGVFPPHGAPRVLWLGVGEGAAEIVEVHRWVAQRLDRAGVTREPRPCHPHVTLARWRTSRPADGRRAIAADGHAEVARVTVDHITLYRSLLTSEGPTYTALSRATLT